MYVSKGERLLKELKRIDPRAVQTPQQFLEKRLSYEPQNGHCEPVTLKINGQEYNPIGFNEMFCKKEKL